MNTSAGSYIDTIAWEKLEDAYGPACKVPSLLRKVVSAKGRKLFQAMDDLCSHVLHQGSIYSASPPVVHVALEMLEDSAPREKAMFYGLLAAFAESARDAVSSGANAGCCVGDPADGEAIRQEILGAHGLFARDLSHPESEIRAQAGALLLAFADVTPATVRMVRDRYFSEREPRVRAAWLDGLGRVHASFDDWPGFLDSALEREDDAANRFTLRHAQVQMAGPGSGPNEVNELVSSFAHTSDDDFDNDQRFFEALRLLGEERELPALLEAFRLATNQDQLRELAQRLLCIGFQDKRKGWGQTSHSRLNEDGSKPAQASLTSMAVRSIGMLILWKLFPFLLRRRLRSQSKPKGIRKIDYWGLEGVAPSIPGKLSAVQQTVLDTLASKPELWRFRTNLWTLFGLPDNAGDLRRFAADRS